MIRGLGFSLITLCQPGFIGPAFLFSIPSMNDLVPLASRFDAEPVVLSDKSSGPLCDGARQHAMRCVVAKIAIARICPKDRNRHQSYCRRRFQGQVTSAEKWLGWLSC